MADKNLTLSVQGSEHCMTLLGASDANLRTLARQTNTAVSLRGTDLMISGEEQDVDCAEAVVRQLLMLMRRGEAVDVSTIQYAVSLCRAGELDRIDELMSDVVAVNHRGRPVKCKTLGQREYIAAIRKHALTFGVGPAGTGKTYLAMAAATVALKNKEVERIVLTRPAVEAGEKLGFLPGDLTQKVDPYLRPLYDALFDLMGAESYQRLADRGVIEVAPLAYMRGRTLSDAFIILDEAQNTTSEQMKMFLTRMGFRSRMVVTGDLTQVDLPRGRRSGLDEALEVLADVPDVAVARLTHRDVVRHEMVQSIVLAYERHARREKEDYDDTEGKEIRQKNAPDHP